MQLSNLRLKPSNQPVQTENTQFLPFITKKLWLQYMSPRRSLMFYYRNFTLFFSVISLSLLNTVKAGFPLFLQHSKPSRVSEAITFWNMNDFFFNILIVRLVSRSLSDAPCRATALSPRLPSTPHHPALFQSLSKFEKNCWFHFTYTYQSWTLTFSLAIWWQCN